jgi:hypothetical protein
MTETACEARSHQDNKQDEEMREGLFGGFIMREYWGYWS